MVIYQIYPNSLKTNKVFKDMADNIQYYKNLNIDVLLFCPITKSPFKDSGYDTSDYYKLNENFGTEEELENLIKVAQENDIQIYMDLVLNHTSNEHMWFKEALKGHSKYKDYYILRESEKVPSKWISGRTMESVWTQYEKNKYYFHIYSPWQPDLNWENEEVKKEIVKIIEFWQNKGVKGFRLDVINKIYKDFENEDEGLEEGNIADLKYHNLDKTFEYIKEITDQLDKETKLIGQVSGASKEQIIRYNEVGIDYTLNFNHVDFNKDGTYHSLENTAEIFIKEINKLFESQSNLMFLESHDLPRSISNFLDDTKPIQSGKILSLLLLLNNQSTIIYQGEELGLANKKFNSIEEFEDRRTIGYYYTRVNNGEDKSVVFDDMNKYSRDQARFYFEKTQNEVYEFYKEIIEIKNKYNDKIQKYSLQIEDKLLTLKYGDIKCYINLGKKSKQIEEYNLEYLEFKVINNG